MKYIALLLLIANLVFFAWQFPQQKFIDQSLPLTAAPKQHNSTASGESLMMLDELPSAVAKQVVTVDIDKQTAPGPAAMKRESSAVSAACWSLGPFVNAAEADHGLTLLTANGIKGRTQQHVATQRVGYRVRLASLASKRAAQKIIDQLAAKGVKDTALMADGDRFMVALGFFKHKESAQQRVSRIARLGYQPIVEDVTRQKTTYRLDLYTATSAAQLDAAWPALVKAYPELQRQPLPCP